MHYLLDTNICIYIAKQKPVKVLDHFNLHTPGDMGMSVVTYGELCFGAQKSEWSDTAVRKLGEFITVVPVVGLDDDVGVQYGRLRLELTRRGELIGNNDLWIASHCLQLGLTLVTNNEREFSRIPDLAIENWTR